MDQRQLCKFLSPLEFMKRLTQKALSGSPLGQLISINLLTLGFSLILLFT